MGRLKPGGVSRKALATAALALLLSAVAAHAVTLFRAPYLQDVRRNAAVVMWATVENGTGTVLYSTDKSFSRTATAAARVFTAAQTGYTVNSRLTDITQFEAQLTGLTADTTYFYRVQVNGQDALPASEVLSLRTAGSGPFTFLAFGDSGFASLEQQNVFSAMSFENPALVLHTGDIAYLEGTYVQFRERYFDYYAGMMKRIPFYPIPGNHEYVTNNAAPYVALHALPPNGTPFDRNRYYSFDWSNVHFVGLDANLYLPPYCPDPRNCDPTLGAAFRRMLSWLDEDLAKSKLFWRVVYWHQPPYAYGPNESDPLERQARDLIVPILEKHDVQLVDRKSVV